MTKEERETIEAWAVRRSGVLANIETEPEPDVPDPSDEEKVKADIKTWADNHSLINKNSSK
jgi:hypothetical protein